MEARPAATENGIESEGAVSGREAFVATRWRFPFRAEQRADRRRKNECWAGRAPGVESGVPQRWKVEARVTWPDPGQAARHPRVRQEVVELAVSDGPY